MSKNLNFAYQLVKYKKYIRPREPNKNHPEITRDYIKEKTKEFLAMDGVITYLEPSANAFPLDHEDLLKS